MPGAGANYRSANSRGLSRRFLEAEVSPWSLGKFKLLNKLATWNSVFPLWFSLVLENKDEGNGKRTEKHHHHGKPVLSSA